MLRVLQRTGVEARLPQEVYEAYKSERLEKQHQFKNSVKTIKKCILTANIGIPISRIPDVITQDDGISIIYDNKDTNCGFIPGTRKTMAEGGNIPCTIATLLSFFKIYPSLFEVGKILVENGYRTENSGTLWLAIEKVPEFVYGVQSTLQDNVWNTIHAISMKQPVLGIVPRKWLHHNPKFSNDDNECIIIWSINKDKAVFTTATSKKIKCLNVKEVFSNIKICWSFQRPM